MAGQEVRGMLIRLEATTAQLRQEMAKADSTVAQVSGRIDAQLSRVDSAFDRAGASAQAAAGVLKGALAGVVSVAGISELLKHAEAYTTIANRLKLVTTGAAEFTAAQNAVFDIAQRSGQPLTATAELYQRIATNQKELKLTGQGVAGIVETISKTMVISGASTESANAALIQLGQAFASGTLRGEELNSVLEQAPALAQAIAKGMGVSVGALRSLGAAGKLTADSVVKALQAQAGAVNELFGRMQVTVSQGMTKLDNSATNLIGRLDQTSGVSQKLGGVLTSVSKTLDAVSADGRGLSKTAENVTSAVEKLAVIIGARLTLSLGQSVVAFLASAGAAIKQAAALTQSSIAADRAVRADAASASQTLLTAQSRQVDAKAMLERANVELATAEQKVAADRVRQASELANLQTVQTALVAERTLEEQRLRAQITEAGRAQSINRLVELRQAEVLVIDQVKAAEISLAQTSAATSAEIQAAYQRRAAAAGAYGETTLAVNEAVAASEKTSAAATGVSRTLAGVSAAGGGLLALLTGPVGILATIGLVAASFIDFGGSAKTATAALIDQNLTIDDSIAKFKELGEAQRTLQVSTWTEKQATALADVSAALNDYSLRGKEAFDQLGAAGIESGQAFARMLEEVRNGSRSLNSVTEWVKENKAILPSYTAMLEQTAAAYEINGVKADKYGKLLGQVSTATTSVTSETGKLAAAQQGSGQTTASQVAWDKYIEQLTKTRDLLGANAAAEAAYTAAKMGATPAQAAQAKIIADQTDVLKKYQEAIKQSAEAEKVRLRAQLVSLYAAEDAANEAAAAQKKALDDTAKAAEDSATRQVNAMQLVINQAVNLTKGRNLLLLPDAKPDTRNQTGYGLLTNGGTAPVAPVKPKATPDQRAEAAVAQLDATTDANKRVDKAANAAATALKNQAKALQELLDKSGISTKASNEMADAYLGGADNVRALTIQQKIEEELLKTGAGARDKVTKAINDMQDAQDRADVAKHISEMRVEIDNLQKEAVATLQGQAAVDAFNVSKAVQASLIGKKIAVGSDEYNQLVATTKAQLENNKAVEQANEANSIVDRLYPQTKLLRDYTRELESLNKAMDLDKDHADAYRDAIARLGVEYEQNQRAATAWGQFTEGAVDRIDSSFADAWKNIDKGFKGFSQSLIDGFKQLLAELAHLAITKPIIMQFATALGIGGAAAQSSGLFGAAGSSGGAGGLLSGASSLYGAVTGWGKAAYTGYQSGGLTGALGGVGNYFGGALSGINAGAGQLVGTALNGGGMTYAPLSYQFSSGALNGAMTGLAGVGGALYGYSQSGLKGAATGAAGGVGGAYLGGAIGSIVPGIGTAIGTAIGGALGSYIGGSLFGGSWQTKDQGLSLGVADGDLSSMQFEYQKKKGGLFSSNKKRTKYSALDADTQSALDDSYAATTGAVFDLFDKLNVTLNDGVLDGLNVAATQISTKGKTADEIQAEVTKWFAGVADSVTSAINTATETGLDGYNFEALTALVNNLYSVNDVFTTLNLKLYDSSVSGGKLAESLSAMAGGLANLQAAASTYYDNFYTDTEKANNVLDSVRKQFSGLDVTFPDTRQAFRNVVDGLDRTTEAGQKMFVTLTSLAGSAASAYSILEQRQKDEQAAAAAAMQNLVGNAFSALQRAINAQKASINDMLATANTKVSDLTGISTSLSNALKALRGDSADAVKMLRSQAQATLQNALAQARSGKSLAGFDGLDDALSVVSGNTTDLYASLEDFNRDQGRTANVVAELNNLNGKQLTTAQQTAKTLQAQLDALDDQLAFAQAQLDALNGVDNSVLTVADAVKAMNAAVVAAIAGLSGKGAAANNGVLIDSIYQAILGHNAEKDGKDYWQNQVASGSLNVNQLPDAIKNAAAANAIKDAYSQSLGHAADAAGAKYWADQVASGALTVAQLQEAIRNAAAANGSLLPGHATGGLITGPGNGTSDSIVARLSNGEYIMTAAATRMFGTGLLDQMNAGRLPAFAAGGPVLSIPSIRQSAAMSAPRAESSDAATLAELRALRDEIRNGLAVLADHARKTSDNTGQLAEVGTQVVGVVQTKVVA